MQNSMHKRLLAYCIAYYSLSFDKWVFLLLRSLPTIMSTAIFIPLECHFSYFVGIVHGMGNIQDTDNLHKMIMATYYSQKYLHRYVYAYSINPLTYIIYIFKASVFSPYHKNKLISQCAKASLVNKKRWKTFVFFFANWGKMPKV